MKATVPTRALAAATKIVLPASQSKGSVMPALRAVELHMHKGNLRLTCTDLDQTIRTSLDAKGSAGTIHVPATLLAKIASTIRGETVTLEATDAGLSIVAGTTDAALAAIPAESWPKLPEPSTNVLATLDVAALDRLERIVGFASPTAEAGAKFGVHFTNGEAVATDGYRLGIVQLGNGADLPGFTVPAPSVRNLLAVASDEVVVTCGEGGRDVTFTSGATSWTARTLEAQYPDYRRLVDAIGRSHRFAFDRAELVAAIAATGATAGTPHNLVIEVGDGEATVSSRTEVGHVVERIFCSGDALPWSLVYNADYLRGVLATSDDDEVEFHCEDNLKPTVTETDGMLAVVMPIRDPAVAS